MKITDAILRLKRLAIPMKVVGLGFLAYHCATADVRFNPIWVAVYIGVAMLLVNACVAVDAIISRIRPKKHDNRGALTAEEIVCVDKMDDQSRHIWRKPWLFLLIAGEDGFFFLPLLYLGVNPAIAVVAAAIFTLMHYQDKPNYTLVGTFLFITTNVLIVLPHGILPMVIGHIILDATAFSMTPILKKWVSADQEKPDRATSSKQGLP